MPRGTKVISNKPKRWVKQNHEKYSIKSRELIIWGKGGQRTNKTIENKS